MTISERWRSTSLSGAMGKLSNVPLQPGVQPLPPIGRFPPIRSEHPPIQPSLPPIVGCRRAQPWGKCVEALRSSRVQLQQAAIPKPPQDLAGAQRIQPHQAAEAGIVHLGVAVCLEQGPELLVVQIHCTGTVLRRIARRIRGGITRRIAAEAADEWRPASS